MHECTNARRDAQGRCFSLWAGVYFGPPVILRVVSLGRVPELLNSVYDTRIRSIANFPPPIIQTVTDCSHNGTTIGP